MHNVRRFYIPNTIVFVTLVTKHRQTLFDLDHPHHVDLCFDKLRTIREAKPFKLLANNFLPDHVHLLLRPTGEATLSSILQSAQHSFTFEYKDHYGIQGSLSLWQHRSWDHLIRDEQDLNRHFDYTHWSAVKHGLVDRPEDWPFSRYTHWFDKGYYEVHWGHATPESLDKADATEFGE